MVKINVTCNFSIEFPPCVQWFTIEFDPQSGTAQPEDCLLISIPKHPRIRTSAQIQEKSYQIYDECGFGNFPISRNAHIVSSIQSLRDQHSDPIVNDDWYVAQMFNT